MLCLVAKRVSVQSVQVAGDGVILVKLLQICCCVR